MNKLRLFITLCLVFWGLVLIPFIAFTNEGQEPFQWYQVIDNGFGEGIGDVIELTGFKGYLYSSGWTGEKAQIWRTADGWNWERVNLEEQLELNTIYLLEVFDDYLYAGTVNRTTGAQLWRSPDGLNWELIVGNGFDHSNVGFYSMIEFNGYIYAGTWCDWGGQMWRTQDFTTWKKVSSNGFGNSHNVAIFCLAEFNGYLYAGTDKWTDGCEIWRTGNGTDWERVVAYGFDNKEYNDVVPDLEVFNGHLYASTMTYRVGFAIWRSDNGIDWEKAIPNGFGDPVNTNVYANWCVFKKHQEYLYAVTIQSPRIVHDGAQVWRTSDGFNWQRVSDYGFGDINNTSFWCLEEFKGHLFVSTQNRTMGAEIWTTMPPNQPPVAVCKDFEISTDENCQASIIAEFVDGGSYDPDEGDEITLSIDNEGPFSPGVHNVNLTVTDEHNESDTCQATVTIVDTTPPIPDATTLPTITGECSADIKTIPTATDNCTGVVIGTTNDPLSYTEQGTYTVTWTYDDGNGNTTVQTQTVTVKDITPPTIENIIATPNVLWPPNHKMVLVTLGVSASDNCNDERHSSIVSVSSSEPVNGPGDGNTAPDWEITGDLTVNLRAERSGIGNGRTYTITVMCTDAYGNSSTETVCVIVPHNQSKKQ